MKIKIVSIFLLFLSTIVTSQEMLTQKTIITSNIIELEALGLDTVTIENSKDESLEIILVDKNPNSHTILIDDNKSLTKVKFKLDFNFKNDVFRKYITERLERAEVLLKVPKNKTLVIYGETVGINSKGYKGNIEIFIDRGNVNLNEVKGNVQVKLFIGNVSASLNNNTNIDIKSKKGAIYINDKKVDSLGYPKKEKALYTFQVNSIKANVRVKVL